MDLNLVHHEVRVLEYLAELAPFLSCNRADRDQSWLPFLGSDCPLSRCKEPRPEASAPLRLELLLGRVDLLL